MTKDIATQIATAVLDEIQGRPDTPTVDELALLVGSFLSCQVEEIAIENTREFVSALGAAYTDESDWATRLFLGIDPNTQEPSDGR